MGQTKDKLRRNEPALGGWNMIPHPAVAELMAGESFDWICVDMEHTSHDFATLENIARATKGSGKDLFVRLPSCDPDAAKKALYMGANGIIVPNVCSREDAVRAVEIGSYPPKGIRGAALARCTDYGRNFHSYYHAHNNEVTIVVMLEHIDALGCADAILSVPGIAACFIGPYDLSASMGLAGQLDHPDVRSAQSSILEACRHNGVAPGVHIIANDPEQVAARLEEGFRFIALGLDTGFILSGCRTMLSSVRDPTGRSPVH